MAYLKCAVVGLLTGIGTTVLWGAVLLFGPALRSMFSSEGGAGANSIAVPGDLGIMPFIVGFALGCVLTLYWQRRRSVSTR